MSTALRQMHCQPVVGRGAMQAQEWQPLTSQVTGWQVADGALCKRFEFQNFGQTMAFVNAVAQLAEAQDHHPEMTVSYGHCTLRWSTHSVGGLSINDFICAARVDSLVPALR
jgi:4a-hydroxytetrahydrobiopterin dehydratase